MTTAAAAALPGSAIWNNSGVPQITETPTAEALMVRGVAVLLTASRPRAPARRGAVLTPTSGMDSMMTAAMCPMMVTTEARLGTGQPGPPRRDQQINVRGPSPGPRARHIVRSDTYTDDQKPSTPGTSRQIGLTVDRTHLLPLGAASRALINKLSGALLGDGVSQPSWLVGVRDDQ